MGEDKLFRFQGVALPKNIFLNHFAFGVLEKRASKPVVRFFFCIESFQAPDDSSLYRSPQSDWIGRQRRGLKNEDAVKSLPDHREIYSFLVQDRVCLCENDQT